MSAAERSSNAVVAPNSSRPDEGVRTRTGEATRPLARLHPDDIAAIEAIVVRATNRAQSPWMTADEAAAYLRCPVSRIRKLTMTDELPHERDGRKVLYHRDQLDEYIRRGGAISP